MLPVRPITIGRPCFDSEKVLRTVAFILSKRYPVHTKIDNVRSTIAYTDLSRFLCRYELLRTVRKWGSASFQEASRVVTQHRIPHLSNKAFKKVWCLHERFCTNYFHKHEHVYEKLCPKSPEDSKVTWVSSNSFKNILWGHVKNWW